MRLGLVGCGFVSALYAKTLRLRPDLQVVGVVDRMGERADTLAQYLGARRFDSIAELLGHREVDLVVNLTNPDEHYAINLQALEAGKHVYCEKPLATQISQAQRLVSFAAEQKLSLSGAPCNVLGEAAQATWRAIRRGQLGTVRLVYAELDDGMIHQAPYRRWANELGVPWPYQDEFEVGCTLEHAGYYLTWLTAFFGPVHSVSCFGAITLPDKGVPLQKEAPDFTVACLRFASGVVARLTCSIVAPHDHELQVIGDRGVLSVDDCWNYRAKVRFRKRMTIRRKLLLSPIAQRVALPPPPVAGLERFGAATMDFSAGIAEQARAIRAGQPSRLSPEFCLHITEVSLIIHQALQDPGVYEIKSRFDPMLPMPWAS